MSRGRPGAPGLLCRAMGIDLRRNGCDLTGKDLFLAGAPDPKPLNAVRRPRIGVDYAGHWARRLLRFYLRDNPFVSKP